MTSKFLEIKLQLEKKESELLSLIDDFYTPLLNKLELNLNE